MYDPGTFQIIAFVLRFQVSEFVHGPFKSKDLVFHSPLALPDAKPHTQLLWGLLFDFLVFTRGCVH